MMEETVANIAEQLPETVPEAPPEKPPPKKMGKRQIETFEFNHMIRKNIKHKLPSYVASFMEQRKQVQFLKNEFNNACENLRKSKNVTKKDRQYVIESNLKLLEKLQDELDVIRHFHKRVSKSMKSREKMALSLDVQRATLMDLLAYGGRNLPLWTGDLGETPPPRMGRLMDDSMPSEGELVAAFANDMWILAEVKDIESEDVLIVRDVDDDARTHYSILREHILLLPLYRFDPKRSPCAVFDRDSVVLALYPQTTCFYKGIVECPPFSSDDSYLITFEDEEYEGGYAPAVHVHQRYVLTWRDHPETSSASKVDNKDDPEPEEEVPELTEVPMLVRKRFKMRDSDETPEQEILYGKPVPITRPEGIESSDSEYSSDVYRYSQSVERNESVVEFKVEEINDEDHVTSVAREADIGMDWE